MSAALLVNALLPVAAAVAAVRRGGVVRRARARCCARRWTRCCRGWSSARSSRRRPRSRGRLTSVSRRSPGRRSAGVVIAAAACSRRVRDRRRAFFGSLTAFALMRTPPPPPGRGAAEPARGGRGRQVRVVAPGAPRLLRDRHERDVLRDAVRAVPGRGGALRRDRRSSGCCGRRRAWARSWPCSTSGWASRVHHNGRAIVLAAAGWGVGHRAVRAGGLAVARAGVRWRSRAPRTRISGIFRGALWNETIPDRAARAPRGRGDDLVVVRPAARQRARRGRARRCSGCGPSIVGGGVLVVAGCARARGRAPALLELRLEGVKPCGRPRRSRRAACRTRSAGRGEPRRVAC